MTDLKTLRAAIRQRADLSPAERSRAVADLHAAALVEGGRALRGTLRFIHDGAAVTVTIAGVHQVHGGFLVEFQIARNGKPVDHDPRWLCRGATTVVEDPNGDREIAVPLLDEKTRQVIGRRKMRVSDNPAAAFRLLFQNHVLRVLDR